MGSSDNIWNKYQRWCRLLILLCKGGGFVCKDILSKMGIKDIADGAEIYSKLRPYKRKIQEMGFYHQKNLLPDNEVIDTTKMDITLSTHIIEILDQRQDYSQMLKLRGLWIKLLHMPECERSITEQQFIEYWNEISYLLKVLNYDMNLVKGLETEGHLSQELENTLQDITHKIEGRVWYLFIHSFFTSLIFSIV